MGDYYAISDGKSAELVLNQMMNSVPGSNMNAMAEQPPKKKARKLKIVLKNSPFKSKQEHKVIPSEEPVKAKRKYYAAFVGDKLIDNPELFAMILEVKDEHFR